jgi:hypothetical protein
MVEFDEMTNEIYLKGFFRDEESGAAREFFVGKLQGEVLGNIVYIPRSEGLCSILGLMGDCFGIQLKSQKLSKLWAKYAAIQ